MSQINVDTIATAAGTEQARLVQVEHASIATLVTGTTVMPHDNTIPQNDEGVQVITQTITPTHASNKLLIQCIVGSCYATASDEYLIALFKDSTAGALACNNGHSSGAETLVLNHYMTTGTTSEIEFKVRFGLASSATVTCNSNAGSVWGGGVGVSSITISEIRV